MTDTTTAVFSPSACTGPAWEIARDQMARPRSHEALLEGVREELAVRDLVARYAYALDQGDLEGVMRFLTDDCVLTKPQGAFAGSEAIRTHFEQAFDETRRRFHLWTNVVVRLSDDLREGWVTSYFYAVLELNNATPHAIGGLTSDQVVKRSGEWRIRARTVADDFTSSLPPPASGVEPRGVVRRRQRDV